MGPAWNRHVGTATILRVKGLTSKVDGVRFSRASHPEPLPDAYLLPSQSFCSSSYRSHWSRRIPEPALIGVPSSR